MWKLLASLFHRGCTALARRRQMLSRWHRSRAGQLIGAFLAAQAAAHAQVVPDGQTATTVRSQGQTTQVTTGTVSGRTGFNSFSQFSVAGPQTVNLILPGQTQNLINIVRDERSVIDGTVNSVRDGAIGGNVFFLNPHGFMVGAGGRLHVGSLSLQTPTVGFVSGFSAGGTPDAAHTQQVLDGSAPVHPDAAIDMRGSVHAVGDVALRAGTLTIGGQVYSGARFTHAAPDFSDLVNARGLASSTGVEQRGGRIYLTCAGDLSVSGTLSSPLAADLEVLSLASKPYCVRCASSAITTMLCRSESSGNASSSSPGMNFWMVANTMPPLGRLPSSARSSCRVLACTGCSRNRSCARLNTPKS
jgi:filamentous hemagglutinin family protein